MDKRALELKADRLELVLSQHGQKCRVTGGTVTPRWVRFQVLPVMGAKVSVIKGLSEELAAALAAEHVRVSRRGATLAVEVPRDNPQPVRLLPLLRQLQSSGQEWPPVTACLGLDGRGTPLLIRLPSPDVAHILVAGMTGSGKTALLRAMLLSLALTHQRAELALVLVDPRDGQAFDGFGGVPHLARPVIRDVEEALEMLTSLIRLMERRDRWRESTPPVVLMIDELADLLLVGGQAAHFGLTRLLQRGRGAGIHVVAATQKPTAAVVGTLVKANFPVRLVGRVASAEDAKVASGWKGTGAERLQGRGDFLAMAEGRVTRFQAAYISGEQIAEVMRERGWVVPVLSEGADRQDEPGVGAREPVVKLPAPPQPPPDPVDLLVQRLVGRGWDGEGSYRSACRLLGMHEGGAEFLQVKAAVDRLRCGGVGSAIAMLQEKETENVERSDGGGVLSDSNSNSRANGEAWATWIAVQSGGDGL